VQGIQADTSAAVGSIGQIAEVVRDMNDHQTTIAGAVEEQTAVTDELTRSVGAAADGASAFTGHAHRRQRGRRAQRRGRGLRPHRGP
jgi:methyl-accepting chemotaxis protein